LSDLYILDDENRPVPVEDPLEWAKWLQENRAREIVKLDQIARYFVSTRFMGMDMDIRGAVLAMMGGPRRAPLVFETHARDTSRSPGEPGFLVEEERCSTWQEAEEQHAEVVRRVKILASG